MAKQNSVMEAETAAPKAADAKARANAPLIARNVMYIGPSFARNGVLFQHGQLFSNGVPASWLDWVGTEPEFRLLLVPHEKVVQRLAELKDPDSAVSTAYRKAEKTAKKAKTGK